MKLPHGSIAWYMVVVGLIALNLAAGPALFAFNNYVLLGVAVTGLAVQIGLVCLIRGRKLSRGFWAGFVVFGVVAALSYVWMVLVAPIATGAAGVGNNSISTPGWVMWFLWGSYSSFVFSALERVPHVSRALNGQGLAPITALTLVPAFAQLLIAVVGGLLTHAIIRSGGRVSHARQNGPIRTQDLT